MPTDWEGHRHTTSLICRPSPQHVLLPQFGHRVLRQPFPKRIGIQPVERLMAGRPVSVGSPGAFAPTDCSGRTRAIKFFLSFGFLQARPRSRAGRRLRGGRRGLRMTGAFIRPYRKPRHGAKGGCPMIEFKCGRCGTEMEATESQAHKWETCPECRTPNRVPTSTALPKSAPDPWADHASVTATPQAPEPLPEGEPDSDASGPGFTEMILSFFGIGGMAIGFLTRHWSGQAFCARPDRPDRGVILGAGTMLLCHQHPLDYVGCCP